MKKFNNIVLLSLLGISISSVAQQPHLKTKKNQKIDLNKSFVHIVKEGENLFSIAEEYHVSIDLLKQWNHISNGNLISANQELVIKDAHRLSIKQQATNALAQKKYGKATQLLNQLYQSGSKQEQEFALEYLGVVREKKGQRTFAKQAYQQFLIKYPKSKQIERVKIRLNNIIGIENLTKNNRLKRGGVNTKRLRSYTRGSLATDYRKSILVNNKGGSKNTLSLANIDVDAKGNYPQKNIDIGFRISVGHYQDLLPNSKGTTERIRYFNVSAKSHNNLYQVSLGRQRSRGKGIFGRFDGIVLSSLPYSKIKFNFTAGYPVTSSKITSINHERKFYGLSVDVENSLPGLDLSVFFFNQNINNLTDRRAVGGQLNYFKNKTSVYSLIDYDIFFNKLNALILSGSYSTKSASRYSWSLDYRKSPYVGTRNALIGQPVDSLSELKNLFTTDAEILDLAVDRTLTSKTASFQYYHPLNKKYNVNTSLTWMNLSGAPGSGGVAAITNSGAQLYTNVYIGAKNLFSKRDYNSLGARYSKLATSNVFSTYITSKYRFKNGFSIMSKLRFDSRTSDNGSSQQNISPSLRAQFQSKKHYFYTDLGGIFYNAKSSLKTSQKTNIYYLYLGYRYYF